MARISDELPQFLVFLDKAQPFQFGFSRRTRFEVHVGDKAEPNKPITLFRLSFYNHFSEPLGKECP